MARADSLAKLALAYGLHLARRRLRRPRSQLSALVATYASAGIRELEPSERERHPRLVTCINCGLCALAAGRIGKTRLPLTRPRRRRRRQGRSLGARAHPGWGLRVIHIMYTVWGDHTIYRANGQEVISPTEALDGGGKLPHARPPVHG